MPNEAATPAMEHEASPPANPASDAAFLKLRDVVPCFYLACAFAAIFATLYVSDWFWVLPHALLVGAGCIHLAVSVGRRGGRQGNPRRGRRAA